MPNTLTRYLLVGVLVLALPGLAACGSSKKKTAAKGSTAAAKGSTAPAGTLPISVSGTATKSTFALPSSAGGGVVTLTLTNKTPTGHGAQLIRFDSPHTATEAFQTLVKQFSGQSRTTPSWLHAEGGLGGVRPGGTAQAVLDLPAGNYIALDLAAGGPQNGPPTYSPLTITAGQAGALPSTVTTVTGANPSKDHYKWQISGPLRPGVNTITFNSKGSEALHQLSAVRLTAKASKAQIIKALGTNGPPPSFVDPSSLYSTAVLDGGKSQTTPLVFAKPGTYLLFCHLTDRTGGKFHYQEGMLTTVTVK